MEKILFISSIAVTENDVLDLDKKKNKMERKAKKKAIKAVI